MKTSEFYPSRLTPLLVRFIQSISYSVAHLAYQVDLKVWDRDVDKLKALEGNRLVLMPNHPTLDDGIILFLLSTRLSWLFHYLVARDSFQGKIGGFLQRMGAYSIARGVGDRASIAYTLELLRQEGIKLVIFPEGGCSYQNDTVMPFRSGAVQIPFQVFNKLAKTTEELPNFYLVPVSLKYRYTKSINKVIARSFQRLEAVLNIVPETPDFYPRLRKVGARVLTNIEAEYGIASSDSEFSNLNQRIQRIKDRVLQDCEQKLQMTRPSNLPSRERVYKIQAFLDSKEGWSPSNEAIYKATTRLLNFDAIYDGYVAAAPTPERFVDTLTRLEREVFAIDRPPSKGHRQAWLRVGDPVNLKDYFSAYKQNQNQTIESLTRQIQQTVQENLNEMG